MKELENLTVRIITIIIVVCLSHVLRETLGQIKVQI